MDRRHLLFCGKCFAWMTLPPFPMETSHAIPRMRATDNPQEQYPLFSAKQRLQQRYFLQRRSTAFGYEEPLRLEFRNTPIVPVFGQCEPPAWRHTLPRRQTKSKRVKPLKVLKNRRLKPLQIKTATARDRSKAAEARCFSFAEDQTVGYSRFGEAVKRPPCLKDRFRDFPTVGELPLPSICANYVFPAPSQLQAGNLQGVINRLYGSNGKLLAIIRNDQLCQPILNLSLNIAAHISRAKLL